MTDLAPRGIRTQTVMCQRRACRTPAFDLVTGPRVCDYTLEGCDIDVRIAEVALDYGEFAANFMEYLGIFSLMRRYFATRCITSAFQVSGPIRPSPRK